MDWTGLEITSPARENHLKVSLNGGWELKHLITLLLAGHLLTTITACVKGATAPPSTVVSSNLRSNFKIDTFNGYIVCSAYFIDVGTGSYYIALESDAVVTCNQSQMYFSNGLYSAAVSITAGNSYRIYVTRPSLNATYVSDPVSF